MQYKMFNGYARTLCITINSYDFYTASAGVADKRKSNDVVPEATAVEPQEHDSAPRGTNRNKAFLQPGIIATS